MVQARSKVSSLMEKVKTHASVIHDLRVLCTSTAVIGPGNEISVLEVIFIHGTLFFFKRWSSFSARIRAVRKQTCFYSMIHL